MNNISDRSVVSSTNKLATDVGVKILKADGNAFDAAAAMAFLLQVIEPDQNGPGGEMVACFYCPRVDKELVLCGQGVAPSAASIDTYQRLGLKTIPRYGTLPAVTPGAVDAWLLLLRDYGSLSLKDVLQPAISYAQNGFCLGARTVQLLKRSHGYISTFWPTSFKRLYPRGNLPLEGDLMFNLELSGLFSSMCRLYDSDRSDHATRIQKVRSAYAEDLLAEKFHDFSSNEIVFNFSTEDSHKSVLTSNEVSKWRASFEEPIKKDYGRWSVHKAGPWTQGPVFFQLLNLLEAAGAEQLDTMSSDFVHTFIEASKLAFADLAAHCGDPNFDRIPLDELLSQQYAEQRVKAITDTCSTDFRSGLKSTKSTLFNNHLKNSNFSSVIERDSTDERCTVHLNVIDKHKNIISATQSGGWLMDSPIIPGLGFPLSSRGQVFSMQKWSPNKIEGSKRPRTTLSPTIASIGGTPSLAFGTPGSDAQDQWNLLFFIRLLRSMPDLDRANTMPVFHSRHLLRSIPPHVVSYRRVLIEDGYSEECRDELISKGHKLHLLPTSKPYYTENALSALCACLVSSEVTVASSNFRWGPSSAEVF